MNEQQDCKGTNTGQELMAGAPFIKSKFSDENVGNFPVQIIKLFHLFQTCSLSGWSNKRPWWHGVGARRQRNGNFPFDQPFYLNLIRLNRTFWLNGNRSWQWPINLNKQWHYIGNGCPTLDSNGSQLVHLSDTTILSYRITKNIGSCDGSKIAINHS